MRVERYFSVENYAEQVASAVQRPKTASRFSRYDDDDYGSFGGGSHWDNGVNFQKALELTQRGDPSLVERYTKNVDNLVNEFQIREEPKQRYVSSVAGSRVSVPDYLGGSPNAMRRRTRQEIQTRTVNIYVCTTCSAGISADNMIKRGCTILSLLEFLQLQQVSVELYLTAETYGRTDGDYIQVIQVQSHPLDLSTAGFAIAHPAFARHLTYDMARVMDGFNGQWGKSKNDYNYYGYRDGDKEKVEDPYQKKLGDFIGMKSGDIYVPAPVYGQEEIMSNPHEWLAKRLQAIKDGT